MFPHGYFPIVYYTGSYFPSLPTSPSTTVPMPGIELCPPARPVEVVPPAMQNR